MSTVKLSSFVMFILIGARIFGLTFYGINGNVWIEELLLGLPGSSLVLPGLSLDGSPNLGGGEEGGAASENSGPDLSQPPSFN